MKQAFYLIFLLCIALPGQAKHVIGGELTMQYLGKPGSYRIQLNQYLDAVTAESTYDEYVTVNIFRKRSPVLMGSFDLSRRPIEKIVYKNAICAKSQNLSTLNVAYSANIQLDINTYSDPAGYYVVWERCCRNNNIANLANSVDVGMVFYLEFPALTQSGKPFVNSSPTFSPLNGNFICLNQLFTTTYSATDADGDQLRYSLVTPYQGYTDATFLNGTTDPRNTYPLVTWGTGYSAGNAIPGSPGLQIDANTGQLTVKASKVGYFLFTVQCDEYRNGVKIGSIRRDFQIPVVDCPPNTPPPAVVTDNGKVIQDGKICEGSALTLSADPDPKWAYQWERDGINIVGATSPSISVTVAGSYAVVKSFATQCSGDVTSPPIKVDVAPRPSAKIRVTKSDGTEVVPPFCEGDNVLASASGVTGSNTYQWQTTASALQVSNGVVTVLKAGLYSLTVTDGATKCSATDQLQINMRSAPNATLTASAPQICQGDSVRLNTTDSLSYQYVWEPVAANKRAELWVKQPGTYRVRITNAAGCTAVSPDRTLAVLPLPLVAADSISPLCASSSRITLRGVPGTGVWTGPGVIGNQFDPMVAGAGLQRLRYTVKSATGCANSATRWVQVSPSLQLLGPVSYRVPRGEVQKLQQQPSLPNATVRWLPPIYLDRPDSPTPMFQAGESTTYTVQAETTTGCQAKAQVAVVVYDRLYVPSAFSPNGDGNNEIWRPINSNSFPDCEVAIYNRWGELMYQGTGANAVWDGRYGQTVVEAGVYTYTIKTAPDDPVLSGKLTVVK
ncbi:gliding motility-associated C-terminal domain-containing protein [Fibrella aquatilis]|uniref:Gliding motility-associated C-terminal domain-containing protein n=1 Tax=Fibrella aquatilis TaxID=2817059 RepID=A0A939G8P4_9BACT|nr:gliding motility-associated C-terminal domain-containing protein [Fibrella aquatilis]MBO0934249.1 gliding motility-associated C-terminal domain-containing protein [Fibrella aquatilis]